VCCWSSHACTEIVKSSYSKQGIAYRALDFSNCCFLIFGTRWRHVVGCIPRPPFPLLQPPPFLQNPSGRRLVGSQTQCGYSDHERFSPLALVEVRLAPFGLIVSCSWQAVRSMVISHPVSGLHLSYNINDLERRVQIPGVNRVLCIATFCVHSISCYQI